MDEHDSLCSHALNNMTVNEMVGEYANLMIERKKLQARIDAAMRALAKISNTLYGIEPSAISPQQIAQDAILAHGRASDE